MDKAEVSRLSDVAKPGSDDFPLKDSLPDGFKQHLTKLDINGPPMDQIDLRCGVKMVTASGEHRVGKMDSAMIAAGSLNYGSSRRNTVQGIG